MNDESKVKCKLMENDDLIVDSMPDEMENACPYCGSKEFFGHQILHVDVCVDECGRFKSNISGGLEMYVYDSGRPFGPFTCCKCGEEFASLPVKQ